MRLISCGLTVTTLALSPLNSLTVHAAYLDSPIVIGEVAWAGSSLSDADEWIELWNLSSAEVDVSGWSLFGAGESGKTIHLPSSSVVPAYGTFLIANYDSTNAKSSLVVTPQVVTTTVSLSNSTLGIELYNNLGSLVDVAGTGTAPPAGASLPSKISMLRQDAELDGSDPSTWSASILAQNLKPELADIATPGYCDLCSVYVQVPEPVVKPTPEPEPESTVTTSTDPVATSTQETIADETIIPEETLPDPLESTTSSTVVETESTTPPIDQTTSTEAVIENQDATSTPDATATQDESASSTQETFVAEQDIQTSTMADQTVQASTETQTAYTPPKPNYAMLRLNEISPYPESGKEWVEIATLDNSNTIPLSGCELHDNLGRILVIGNLTLEPTVNRYLKIEIPSSRLNNDGDSVSLYAPDGQLLDTISYGSMKKSQVLVRYPDLTTTWQKSDQETPETANVMSPDPLLTPVPTAVTPVPSNQTVIPSPSIQASQTLTPVFPALQNISTKKASTTKAIKTPSASAASASKPATKSNPTKSSTSTKSVTAVAKKTTAPKTIAKKTTSSATKTVPIKHLTFSMLNQIEDAPLRVRLEGTVGSTPGLLPYHSFVLQSPEGRGLQIRVPTSRRLPAMGSAVSVVGQLYVDDAGVPYVKMATKDPLDIHGTSTGVTPRLVDLTAPSIEDVWALMSVTGTVIQVKGRTVSLDLGDAFLDISIKQSVKYRPQRLVSGDIVRVNGLLDPNHDIPVLLPRSADDIVLVGHAKTLSAAGANPFSGPEVPGWTPIGAAAGAVAVTEGAKHLNRRRKQRLLEKKLTQLTKIQA